MNYKQHLLIGAILTVPLTLLLYFYFQLPNTFIYYGLSLGLLSSLLPDIDHSNSKIHKSIKTLTTLTALIISTKEYIKITTHQMALVLGTITALTTYILFTLLKPRHRGITHTMTAVILTGALTYYLIGPYLAIITATGYLSHLLADTEIKII